MELELFCLQNGSAVLKRVLRSSEACFGRGAPANYLELAFICPVLGTNYLALELICPQNGSAVRKELRIAPLPYGSTSR